MQSELVYKKGKRKSKGVEMTDYKKIIKLLMDKEKTLIPRATVAGKIGVTETYIGMILSGATDPGPKVKVILEKMIVEL